MGNESPKSAFQTREYAYSGYDRTIDSHINRLRAKIEANPDEPKMVLTVWEVGYKFNDEA